MTVTSHWVGLSTCGGVSCSCTTVTSSPKSTTEPNMALVSEPLHVRYVRTCTYVCAYVNMNTCTPLFCIRLCMDVRMYSYAYIQ